MQTIFLNVMLTCTILINRILQIYSRKGLHSPDSPSNTTSSWGGSVAFDAATSKWNMYAAEMVNHCGIGAWESNSRIVRATSASPVRTPRFQRIWFIFLKLEHAHVWCACFCCFFLIQFYIVFFLQNNKEPSERGRTCPSAIQVLPAIVGRLN